MYLIERLSGVMLYSVILLCVTYYIYHTRKLGKTLGVYALILAVMAYFYKPAVTADLYRIYEAMDYFSHMPWEIFYKELISTPTPAYLVYVRLIGKIGIKELLPAITAFIYYQNMFYVLKRSVIKYKISNKRATLVLLFVMSFGQYVQVISGIRSMLAFSIVVRCMYEEIVEGKKILFNMWKYILAFLLHPVGVAACVIRILYEVFWHKARTYIQLVSKIILTTFVGVIGIKFGTPYIEHMLKAASEYMGSEGYSYVWEYLLAFIVLALIVYSLYKFRRSLSESIEIRSLTKLVKFLILVVCVLIFEYSTFQRFTVFISMLFIPIYVYILSIAEENLIKNEKYIQIMFCVSLMMLGLACLRGNLSAYKFFIL